MTINFRQAQIEQAALVAALFIASCLPAHAQYATLRDPLIPGAMYMPPGVPAPVFLPPPPGCGPVPYPVNPGMLGGPSPEPSRYPIPPVPVNNKSAVNGYLGGALQPPNSTAGSDPGNLAPNNSGYNPPAADVPVSGGLAADSAPTSKWGGQTTRDFGNGLKQGSSTCDFGQLLINKPGLAKQPQFSQDGPVGSANHTKMGAGQGTTDPGIRELVHQQVPRQTQAPY